MKCSFNKTFIFIFLILALLSFQAVSADELNQTTGEDSFDDFQKVVDESVSEINVTKDYTYHDGDKPITVNKSIVINGNNHSFDALGKSNIFLIEADNVIINNIVLKNANFSKSPSDSIFIIDDFSMNLVGYDGLNEVNYDLGTFTDAASFRLYSNFNGGAIYSTGNNLKITDSRFVNNYASRGGAVFILGDNSQILNSVFINNTAKEGGAVFNSAGNLTVSKSIFDLNYAKGCGNAIYSSGGINVTDCRFLNTFGNSIVFHEGSWQIDNMTSGYYHSFIKLNKVNFKYNLTHISGDYYNFKITFGYHPYWYPEGEIVSDYHGFSTNKKFSLEVNGKSYNLTTDGNGEANIKLQLFGELGYIKVFNPITKLSIFKVINDFYITENRYYDTNYTISTSGKHFKITVKKIVIAKKPVKIKIKIKNPTSNKVLKVKFKGKTYKIKINKKCVGYFKLSKKIFKTLKKGKKYSYIIKYENTELLRYIKIK